MTITVKGTRTPATETGGSREKYILRTGTVFSNVPVLIALALTGLVAYLKSFFAEYMGGGDPLENSASPSASQPPHPEAATATGAWPPDDGGKEGEVEDGAERPMSSGGAFIDREPVSFVMLDSPAIAFEIPRVTVKSDNDLFEIKPRAGNDNFGTVSGGGSPGRGGSGSSSGPGGGNGSDDDTPPDDDDDDTPGNPPNRTPRSNGPVYLGDFVTGHAAVITFAALLQNAQDPDGDALQVKNLSASSGTLVPVQGGWLYTPAEGMVGFATFTYMVSDGVRSVHHSAELRVVLHHTVEGTAKDDALLGSIHADRIDGREGNDNVDARGGHDVVWAGTGDDHVVAGAGNDQVSGGSGDDVIFGGAGNDVISGNEGDDRLFGEEGDDTLSGDEGDDMISGGTGNDLAMGGAGGDEIRAGEGNDVALGGGGHDTILGDAGNDLISSGAGNDTAMGGDGADRMFGDEGGDILSGNEGDDILDGGAGADEVRGGTGNDVIIATSDATSDCYDGGTGCDTLDMSGTALGVLVDLTTGKAVGVEIGEDDFDRIEEILGGSGDDVFIVGTNSTHLSGGDGDDEFRFTALVIPQSQPPVMHSIHDFAVGDRICISDFEISRRLADDVEDLFEDIYSDSSNSGPGRSIRYRNERVDELERTFVEADMDGDALYELSINLDGHHVLFIAENIA